jgi:protein SCO1/2
MPRRAVISLTGMAVLAAISAILAVLLASGGRPTMVDIGGRFHLASSKGGAVDSQDLIGKPYAVFFGFTHCPEVCPTTLYEMSQSL